MHKKGCNPTTLHESSATRSKRRRPVDSPRIASSLGPCEQYEQGKKGNTKQRKCNMQCECDRRERPFRLRFAGLLHRQRKGIGEGSGAKLEVRINRALLQLGPSRCGSGCTQCHEHACIASLVCPGWIHTAPAVGYPSPVQQEYPNVTQTLHEKRWSRSTRPMSTTRTYSTCVLPGDEPALNR